MNTPKPSRGLGRFAPTGHSTPPALLRDLASTVIDLLEGRRYDDAIDEVHPADRQGFLEQLAAQRPDLIRQLAFKRTIAVMIPPSLIAQAFARHRDTFADSVLDEVITFGAHLWRPDMVDPARLIERLRRLDTSPPRGPGETATSLRQHLDWPRGAAAVAAAHDYELLRELVAQGHLPAETAMIAAARAARPLWSVPRELDRDAWQTWMNVVSAGLSPHDDDITRLICHTSSGQDPVTDVWDAYRGLPEPNLVLSPQQRIQLLGSGHHELCLLAAFAVRDDVVSDKERDLLRSAVNRPKGGNVLAALGQQGPTLLGSAWVGEHITSLDESALRTLALAAIDLDTVGGYPADLACRVGQRLPSGLPFEEWCAAAQQPTAHALVEVLGPDLFISRLGPDPDTSRLYKLAGVPHAMGETTEEAPHWLITLAHHALGTDPATWDAAEGFIRENPELSFRDLAACLRHRGWPAPEFIERSSP